MRRMADRDRSFSESVLISTRIYCFYPNEPQYEFFNLVFARPIRCLVSKSVSIVSQLVYCSTASVALPRKSPTQRCSPGRGVQGNRFESGSLKCKTNCIGFWQCLGLVFVSVSFR